jgi:lysyl-tRNA synthetase, class I
MVHWSEKLAQRVLDEFPNETRYTCASGISPSGIVHAGNFRDLITSEAVFRSLNAVGANARLLLSWDDFDRLRKVPQGMPGTVSQYIGMPLSDIPDPWGEFKSYAVRYESIFESTIKQLGIEPEIVRQSEKYRAGTYDSMIQLCLRKRLEMARLMARFKSQGMAEDEIEHYFPITLYSRFTGKDNTRILDYDGETKVTYRCKDTEKTDTIDITKDRRVKLAWKIDWPMRWVMEHVSFEPGGRDHASSGGGSYEVSKEVSLEIFGRKAPIFQGYDFIGIRGMHEKMSSSKGKVVTVEDLLEIYEPEMIRWLYLRTNPEQEFKFAFDQEVFRMYNEFDEFVRHALSSAEPNDKHFLSLVTADKKFQPQPNPAPFRQIAGYGQIADIQPGKLDEILSEDRLKYSPDSVDSRLKRSRTWLERYNPETVTRLKTSKDKDYLKRLTDDQKNQVQALYNFLSCNENPSVGALESWLYDIPKSAGLNDSENKKRQRDFFKVLYSLMFGTETGPRLPTFLWATDRQKVLDLLDVKEN